ncbi:hypothetical protein [Sedimenticola selenatireducens]|uniref:hypothetical protein n=1 Tax=Sedimenticola selenatireducens TaxID=191960 RepID=UPI00048F2564|nr:hypothetical protein [Sedimenticola selenatireducens]
MKNSRLSDIEIETLQEFCEFVEAQPVEPSPSADARITARVKQDLQPSIGWLYAKFATIEAGAGVATLFFCPQFGFAFSGHNAFFHALHEQTGFFTFYLICGLLFVVLGAAMSALLLSYNELKSIKMSKYLYYLMFGVVAFLSFFVAGAEILWLSAMPWILGAYLGNLLGFGVVARVRETRRSAY